MIVYFYKILFIKHKNRLISITAQEYLQADKKIKL